MSRQARWWRGWRAHLLNPLSDAALGLHPDSAQVKRHAMNFPGAEAEAIDSAARAADLGFPIDEGWVKRRALAVALDRQDNAARLVGRSLTAVDRLEVRGQWPQGVFVAMGLHWGTGFPVLEHLLKTGRQPAFVYRPERDEDLPSLPARFADRLHLRALRGFGHTIAVGGAYERILGEFAAGCIPVILFDAPATAGAREATVERPGLRIRLRTGLPGLVAEHHLPYVFFRCSHRPGQRRRLLEISKLQRSDQPGEILERAGDFLLESLHLDAAQWHFWPVARDLLETTEPAAPNAGTSPPPTEQAAS